MCACVCVWHAYLLCKRPGSHEMGRHKLPIVIMIVNSWFVFELSPLFSKKSRPRALFTLRLLSEEACLYAGVDWLTSSVSQRAAIDQLTS